MKQLISIILLFVFVSLSSQEMPKYYFNIQSVLSSPYTIEDSDENYSNFRALAVSEEGHFYIVIEQISLKGIEGREKALLGNYLLLSDKFDKYMIDEVQLMEWKSKFTLVVEINGEEDYEIDISQYSNNKISVKKIE